MVAMTKLQRPQKKCRHVKTACRCVTPPTQLFSPSTTLIRTSQMEILRENEDCHFPKCTIALTDSQHRKIAVFGEELENGVIVMNEGRGLNGDEEGTKTAKSKRSVKESEKREESTEKKEESVEKEEKNKEKKDIQKNK